MGDLREKVARALARKAYSTAGLERVDDPYTPDADYWLSLADAAIAIVLEEAAKVVEAMPRTYNKVKEDQIVLGMKGTWTFTLNNGPSECAAAIRALMEKAP